MVAALVVLSFVVLVVASVIASAIVSRRAPAPADLEPGTAEAVEGFSVYPDLAYHPRHLWVGGVGRSRVRVGLDDFVRRIVGPPDRVRLPGEGRELREGVHAIELVRAGRTVRLPAPVTGTVVAMNREVIENPELAAADPMGRGWLLEIRLAGSRAAKGLIRGRKVRAFMEAAANRMRAVLIGNAGLALTDGGVPVEDYKLVLDDDSWAWLLEWAFPEDVDADRR